VKASGPVREDIYVMIKLAVITLLVALPTSWAFVERHEKGLFRYESNIAEIMVHNRIVEIEELKGRIVELEQELEAKKKKPKRRKA
jgi:hypothetical protein